MESKEQRRIRVNVPEKLTKKILEWAVYMHDIR